MTAISNLRSILERGLLSHNEAYKLKLPVTDISDQDVQDLRSIKRDSIYNRPLHDYVCLYFSPRNPMLYVRRDMQEDIVFLGINPHLLLEPNTIFSDGNAAAVNTKFYCGTAMLNELPWDTINARYWTNFEDGKRIKCAEVLVYRKVTIQNILKIFCYSGKQHSIVCEARPSSITIPVEVTTELYF